MNRSTKRRSRLLVVTGSAIVIALGSLAACVTNLSYRYDPNAEGGTSEGGSDRRVDDAPSGTCNRLLLIGGNIVGAGPTGLAYYGQIAGTNVNWTQAPSPPYPTAAGGAIVSRGRVVIAGGFNHYNQYTTFSAGSWQQPPLLLPGKGASCTLGALVPGGPHLVCAHDGDADGGFESAFYGPDDGKAIAWVDAKPSAKLQPNSMAAAIAGRWVVVAPDGTTQVGTPQAGIPQAIDWADVSNRPIATGGGGCTVTVDDRAYFIGGDGSAVVLMASFVAGSFTWSIDMIQPIPEKLAGAACVYASGRIWVAGGARGPSDYADTVYSARPAPTGIDSDGWVKSTRQLLNPVSAASLVCIP